MVKIFLFSMCVLLPRASLFCPLPTTVSEISRPAMSCASPAFCCCDCPGKSFPTAHFSNFFTDVRDALCEGCVCGSGTGMCAADCLCCMLRFVGEFEAFEAIRRSTVTSVPTSTFRLCMKEMIRPPNLALNKHASVCRCKECGTRKDTCIAMSAPVLLIPITRTS